MIPTMRDETVTKKRPNNDDQDAEQDAPGDVPGRNGSRARMAISATMPPTPRDRDVPGWSANGTRSGAAAQAGDCCP